MLLSYILRKKKKLVIQIILLMFLQLNGPFIFIIYLSYISIGKGTKIQKV